jgi:hypothetical protein
MRPLRRIPVWYILPLVIVLAIGLWIGGLLVPSRFAPVTPVTPVVNTQPTVNVAPTINAAVAATQTAAPRASTPTPVARNVAPTAPRATAGPTATAAPSATPAALSPDTVLTYGEPWTGEGVKLTTRGEPQFSYGGKTRVYFRFENSSGTTLNFDVPETGVYMEMGGRRYNLSAPLKVNGLRTSQSLDLDAQFTLDYRVYEEAARREPSMTLNVRNFSSRIPQAQWRLDLAH